ncbi:MAG: restriction endonuclease subunit S [Bacteroidales bacterium]|nr:restriction endonuclease subunit S [Bacteroidales bacterium]
MRAGWKIKTIGDVCEIRSGRSQKEVENPNGEYPIYGSGGIMGYANDYLCEAGATIIGRKGSINNPIFVETKFWNVDTAFGFSPKENIFPKFLFYFCKGFNFQDMNKGTTIPSLVKTDLLQIRIPIPSLPEQQRIVDILDREFAKIDALKANAEKSLQAAKDLFQATTDTMMSNGQWRELSIGEIAKIKGGKRVPKGYKLEKEPTAHRYIRVADFTDLGTIRTESVLYISDEVYKSIKAYTISSKDVYISIAGTIGKSGIIPDTLDGANLTENACKLVLGPNFYNRFVFFATKTSSFKKQVETLTMQAAQPKLALTRLATIRVRVPSSIKEQETIVERLDGIADTIALLQDNYQKTLALCEDLKQSLLRKAFNGEL